MVEPVDDPRGLLTAADVFVSASREEAFCYAIGEALACGVPELSSNIAGPAAYFAAQGVTTFRSEDPAALAGGLGALLRGTVDLAAAVSPNRAFLDARFGLDRHVERVLDVFRAVLRRRRQPVPA